MAHAESHRYFVEHFWKSGPFMNAEYAVLEQRGLANRSFSTSIT